MAREANVTELHLTEDTLVHLGAHKLRIAELQRDVSSVPRPPVDPNQPYTEGMAEADIARVSALLDPETHGNQVRARAALILSKLHGWKLGAPPESPGHAYARRVHDGEIP